MAFDYDLDDDDTGFEPWALGDRELDPHEETDSGEDDGPSGADRWLDEQLERFGTWNPTANDGDDGAPAETAGKAAEAAACGAQADGDGDDVALRRPAPTRPPRRRRRADAAAATDLPAMPTPGYMRDRRGTWRYSATGRAVPGARDLTLRFLHRFPVNRTSVLVPVERVRTERELAWCMAWKHTLTTALQGGRVHTLLRIPVGEWDRRADIPIGLWAPELTATRLLGVADVARLAGVTPATITAYLARRRLPEPVIRIGNSPAWSRPVIHHWLVTRPGQGIRPNTDTLRRAFDNSAPPRR